MDRPLRPPADPSMAGQARHRLEQGREATGSGASGAKSRDEDAAVGPTQDRVATGVVRELLPSQLVRVELDGRHQVTAHLADPVRRNFVRVLVGDRVRVVLTTHDPTRARIVERL
jgi:translation initiation factor IF-1